MASRAASLLRDLALGGVPPWRRGHGVRKKNATTTNSLATTAAHKNLLTVIVTASMSPLNPSTVILRELLLSLRLLNLPPGTEVLLSHDVPPAASSLSPPSSSSTTALPPAYAKYLANVERLIPAAQSCTQLTIKLLRRETHGGLAGNLEFALSRVRTPYFLKVEHDHPFVREVDVLSVVRDMISDKRLKVVRFNRRRNIMVRCDAGEVNAHRNSRWKLRDTVRAQSLWGRHEPRENLPPLVNQYCRTACFSDMNHVASTAYYKQLVLPLVLREPSVPPETLMQAQLIARDHARFGTYIYGAVDARPAIIHVDAALHASSQDLGPFAYLWLKLQRLKLNQTRGHEAEAALRCTRTTFFGADEITESSQLPSELRAVAYGGRTDGSVRGRRRRQRAGDS